MESLLRLLLALAIVLAAIGDGGMAAARTDMAKTAGMTGTTDMEDCRSCAGHDDAGQCAAACVTLSWGETALAPIAAEGIGPASWSLFDESRLGEKPAPPRAPPRA
jgi:hypothetical protein